jgi:hypothetical protein
MSRKNSNRGVSLAGASRSRCRAESFHEGGALRPEQSLEDWLLRIDHEEYLYNNEDGETVTVLVLK